MRYSVITTGLLLAVSTASALHIPRQEPAANPSPAAADVAAPTSTTGTTTTDKPAPTILPDQAGNTPGNVQNPAVFGGEGNNDPPAAGEAGGQNPAGGEEEGKKDPPPEGQTNGQEPGASSTTADKPSSPVETDKPASTDGVDQNRPGTPDPSGNNPVEGQPAPDANTNNPDKTNPDKTNPDAANPDKTNPSKNNPNKNNPNKHNPDQSTKPFTPAGWYEYLSLANIVLRVAREGGPSYLYALKTITDAALDLFEEQSGNGGDDGHGKGGSGHGQGQGQGQGQWNHNRGHGPSVNAKREPGDYAGSDNIDALELATDSYNTYWQISQGTA